MLMQVEFLREEMNFELRAVYGKVAAREAVILRLKDFLRRVQVRRMWRSACTRASHVSTNRPFCYGISFS